MLKHTTEMILIPISSPETVDLFPKRNEKFESFRSEVDR